VYTINLAASTFIAMSASSNGLEARYRLAELLVVLGVANRGLQGALGHADRLGADRGTSVVEGLERGLQPGAGFSDDPVAGDVAVLEIQLCGG
jgi:hypothetical protein